MALGRDYHHSERVPVRGSGQLVVRRLEDVAVVVHLDELAPFGGGHGRERRAARA